MPWTEILAWHRGLLHQGEQVASLCLTACNGFKEHDEAVRRLVREKRSVGKRKLCEFFGAPVGFELPSRDHPYHEWLVELWGRKCNYYLGTLLSGLREASACKSVLSDVDGSVVKRLLELHNKVFDESFRRMWALGSMTPESNLVERGDIAHFQFTYLDPNLFSALRLLASFGHKRLQLNYKAQERLWALIEE